MINKGKTVSLYLKILSYIRRQAHLLNKFERECAFAVDFIYMDFLSPLDYSTYDCPVRFVNS